MQIEFNEPDMQNAASLLRQAHNIVDDKKSHLSAVIGAQDSGKWGHEQGPEAFMSKYISFLADADASISKLLERLKWFESDLKALQASVTENDEGAAGAYNRTQQTLPTYQPADSPTATTPPSGSQPVATQQ